ncbi:MAG: hypothetical protein FJW20_04965 [Acidimicrobiia bacterium]|nr:hypothetical protein [Acidimicrobiia bacterium]
MRRHAAVALLAISQLCGQEQPVAVVDSKVVLLDELDPPQSWQDQHRAKLSTKEYEEWLQRSRGDRLGSMIWAAVKRHFCADKDCAPNEAEIQGFQEAMARMNRQRRTVDDDRLRAIDQSLARQLAAPEREKLEKEKELLIMSRDALAQGLPATHEYRMAEQWVSPWKFFRVLHRAYGGRVIFQQAGPEPLDAMTKLLREQEKRGTFAIYHLELHRQFWAYYTTMGHTFMPDGAKFLETPWWLQPQPKR